MKKITKVTGGVVASAIAVAASAVVIGPIESADAAAQATSVKLSSFVTGEDASAGLEAAADAVQRASNHRGGTIIVDGSWTVDKSVDLSAVSAGTNRPRWNAIVIRGNGPRASTLKRTVSGPIFSMTQSRGVGNLAFLDMGFVIEATAASYIWEFTNGFMTNSRFQGLTGEVLGQGGIINLTGTPANPNGAEFHTNAFRDSMFYVSKVSKYVPMNFTVAGHFANGNSFDGLWLHHRLNDKVPFILMKPNSSTFTNNSFRAITGEQNLGGLIHLSGMDGGSIENTMEWDGGDDPKTPDYVEGYANDVIKISNSWGFGVMNCGRVVKNYGKTVKNGARTIRLINNQYVTTMNSAVGNIPPFTGSVP